MRRKHHLRYQWRFTHLASLARSLTAGSRHMGGGLLAVLAALLVIMSAQAQGNAQSEPCPGGGYNPTPTAVDVEAVPIVVESTAADYFVLYVRHDVDTNTVVEYPVAVTLGETGTTTLSENVATLPAERYRVEKFLIADPADVDGDCIDDITELADPVGMSPVNAAPAIAIDDGAVAVPDQETREMISTRSNARRYLKFVLFDMDTDAPGVYFMNTETHPGHASFLDTVGIEWDQDGLITGQIIYHPELIAPDGSPGVYTFYWNSVRVGRRETNEPDGSWVYQSYHFSLVTRSYTVLAASMPLLDDNLAFYIRNSELPSLQTDLPLYNESRINLVFDIEIYADTGFLALNPGEGYGLLRIMDPDERPHPRNIVIYEALPNELPRVAGIVSTVPQTPLSHVNLRAVQDAIPNAYIRGALDTPKIDALLGSYVHYKVTENGWEMRAATRAEVDAHYATSRPAQEQTPQSDLSVTSITPLSEIGFEDWKAFGVKAANVAVLGTLGFPAGTVPDGFAVPFYFYDEFMKAHDFYPRIENMLANENFQTDFEVQDDMLDDLRNDIKDAETPQWIIDALTAMHATYPEGQSLRYRSSTNNEDLPGFNGAGLYDSKTQDPEETEEDGISKSLKQVWASLWNFRAFTERDFHRIDHLAAAMGVLVHPNYSDELANGVAVSFDPIYVLDGNYYVNTQVGEDLVTNPEAHSIPEELLLRRDHGTYTVLSTSNLVEPGELIMSEEQLGQLRGHLTAIHDHFEGLYNPAPGEPFAMEIEFKITSDNILAIKQARPWVFSVASPPPPPPPPEQPQPQTQQPQPQTQQPQPQTQQPQPQTQQPQPQTQQPQPQTQQPPPPPPPSPPESPNGTVLITERDEEFALSPNNEGGSITYGGKTIKLTVTRDEKLPSSSNNPAIILSPDLLDRIDEITFDLSADSPENPPAGFWLGGFAADIDLGVELEEGETVTMCLPEPAGGEELVLHHYDEESGMWNPLESSVETVNGVRSVCTETDVFLLFGVFVAEQSGLPDDTGSPTDTLEQKKGGGGRMFDYFGWRGREHVSKHCI